VNTAAPARVRSLATAKSGRATVSAGPPFAVPSVLAGAFEGIVGQLVELVADAVVGRLEPLLKAPARPALLDRRGLALALGVGLDTVDRMRGEGMPELRVGDAPRFELDAVIAWLRGRRAS
jgi:hypothetical protein